MWDQERDQEGEMITYMSISGEASCNGLYSSREGQTLVLRAGGTPVVPVSQWYLWVFSVNKDSLCSLPSWLRHGKVWQSLDLKLKLEISQSQVSDEYPGCNSLLLFSSNQTQSAPRSSLAPGNQPMGLNISLYRMSREMDLGYLGGTVFGNFAL